MLATLPQSRPVEETARLGEEIYARLTKTVFGAGDYLKYGAISVDTGDFEIDSDDRAAIDRLKAREPNARVWLVRIGEPAAVRFRTPL